MKYEIIGVDCCDAYRLMIESIDYSWDRKTAIIHVKLPKIKEKEKDNNEKI